MSLSQRCHNCVCTTTWIQRRLRASLCWSCVHPYGRLCGLCTHLPCHVQNKSGSNQTTHHTTFGVVWSLLRYFIIAKKFSLPLKDVFAWTDRTIWIVGSPRRLKTYIGNRVSYIVQLISPDRWSHVNGLENPRTVDCFLPNF